MREGIARWRYRSTLKVSEPVTWSAEPVTRVALPVSVDAVDTVGKALPRIDEAETRNREWSEVTELLLLTRKSVTKFSRLA